MKFAGFYRSALLPNSMRQGAQPWAAQGGARFAGLVKHLFMDDAG